MTCPEANMKPAVLPSPLQSLVTGPQLPLSSSSPTHAHPHLPSLHTLALQIQHNLQYQHAWTALRLHTHSPLTGQLLPRPLLSGLPPQRLYVHPDEQIELLKQAEQERRSRDAATLELKTEPECEWILPTRLSEKWTLHRLSDVFAAISLVPPEPDPSTSGGPPRSPNAWRTTKRAVLATVDADSTVVYYIIHEGPVKPRQN